MVPVRMTFFVTWVLCSSSVKIVSAISLANLIVEKLIVWSACALELLFLSFPPLVLLSLEYALCSPCITQYNYIIKNAARYWTNILVISSLFTLYALIEINIETWCYCTYTCDRKEGVSVRECVREWEERYEKGTQFAYLCDFLKVLRNNWAICIEWSDAATQVTIAAESVELSWSWLKKQWKTANPNCLIVVLVCVYSCTICLIKKERRRIKLDF